MHKYTTVFKTTSHITYKRKSVHTYIFSIIVSPSNLNVDDDGVFAKCQHASYLIVVNRIGVYGTFVQKSPRGRDYEYLLIECVVHVSSRIDTRYS